MKNLKVTLSIASILLLAAFTFHSSTNWQIAEDYSIKFTSDDPSGVFTKLKGDISFDPQNLSASKFDLKVEVSSISTGNGIKNRHAKSKKWFDADKFPNIHFVSSKFIKTDKGYSVMGNLSIHGVTKEFTMPFTFVKNTFTSSYMINRLDFKIGTREGMSAKVPAELLVEISVPVSKL